jgi:hypothetical protein
MLRTFLKNADEMTKAAVEIADDVQPGEQIEHNQLGSKELTDGIAELNEDANKETKKETSFIPACNCHDVVRKIIKGGIKKSKIEKSICEYI